MLPSRRSVLHAFLSAPAASLLASASAGAQPAPAPLTRTPSCDGLEPTPPVTEGPFYKPDAPQRRNFADDVPDGERITLAGFVLDEQCRPQAQALVELWHADDEGRYDNAGYRLRGHQFTDDNGRWWFTTIMPAVYTGRTRHYHTSRCSAAAATC